MPTKRFYIAGPMTGYESYNAAAFREAAEGFRAMGHEVETPLDCNSRVWRKHERIRKELAPND